MINKSIILLGCTASRLDHIEKELELKSRIYSPNGHSFVATMEFMNIDKLVRNVLTFSTLSFPYYKLIKLHKLLYTARKEFNIVSSFTVEVLKRHHLTDIVSRLASCKDKKLFAFIPTAENYNYMVRYYVERGIPQMESESVIRALIIDGYIAIDRIHRDLGIEVFYCSSLTPLAAANSIREANVLFSAKNMPPPALHDQLEADFPLISILFARHQFAAMTQGQKAAHVSRHPGFERLLS